MEDGKKLNAKLAMWQERLERSRNAFSDETAKMDERERLYNGMRELSPLFPDDVNRDGDRKRTSHIRNIIFELIESQVSSSVPTPKVTPRRKEDEHLASVIEHLLRNELDRLPFEALNDLAERSVLIQGGVGFLVEWDSGARSPNAAGEVTVTVVHPKQFAPQPGVYTGIDDMDWFILKVPTTKEAVRRKYGIDVSAEGESEPDVRTSDGSDTSEDNVTEYIGYERTDEGGINLYAWVDDIELEDLENYQARRQPVCKHCGRVRPLPGQVISDAAPQVFGEPAEENRTAERFNSARRLALGIAGLPPGAALDGLPTDVPEPEPVTYDGGPCPYCGSDEWTSEVQDYEQVHLPIVTAGGLSIPGDTPGMDEAGNSVMRPTSVPFYRPDLYPVVLQRSVSMYGKLLGSSDVDMIRDQQNTINRLEQQIIERLLEAGTRITLPDRADFRIDPKNHGIWYIGNAADKQLIGSYEFTGNLQYELAYLQEVYEEARQMLGITDSFQGRKDTTATSGTAKQFAAAQSAGRLESKRVMKNAAYAEIFERIFKLYLAYSDEPRTITYRDTEGNTEYETFNRYDFLEQDKDGNYVWNDQFLFSVDTAEPLAQNREAMWQETRMNLQTGAFGDPTALETLILFWSKMEELHYPGAGQTKTRLEERLQQQQAALLSRGIAGAGAPLPIPREAVGQSEALPTAGAPLRASAAVPPATRAPRVE